MKRAVGGIVAALACGCIDDLDPKEIITGPRIVEVIAEPPEVRPGEVSTLSVMLAGTRGTARLRWSACAVTDLGSIGAGSSASVDDCFRDGGATLPLGTGETATFVLPASILGRVTEAVDRFRGLLPPGVVETFLREVGLAVPVLVEVEVEGRRLRALKRVIVSLNPSPHRNPPSPRVRFGQRWVSVAAGAADRRNCVPEDGAPLELVAGQELVLTPDPDERWIETYTVLTADGRFERRDEQAYYSWYATGGALRGLTRSPIRDNVWTLPRTTPETRDQSVWVILRDGHGGASGCRVDLRVVP